MITELQLELSVNCNSNCIMCPRNLIERNIDGGLMKTEFAKFVIDEAKELGAKMLKPQWFGESTLHPDYLEILDYAKENDYKIVIFTNGSLFRKRIREELIRIGVDKVFWSIDASNEEEYEKIRRGLKFKTVVDNMRKFFNEKGPETKLIISAVELGKGNTEHLKKTFIECSDGIVINKEVKQNEEIKQRQNIICRHQVQNRLIVGFDGKCYLCCHDWLGRYFIGDLVQESMEEIWNGEKRNNFIKNLKSLDICQRCSQ